MQELSICCLEDIVRKGQQTQILDRYGSVVRILMHVDDEQILVRVGLNMSQTIPRNTTLFMDRWYMDLGSIYLRTPDHREIQLCTERDVIVKIWEENGCEKSEEFRVIASYSLQETRDPAKSSDGVPWELCSCYDAETDALFAERQSDPLYFKVVDVFTTERGAIWQRAKMLHRYAQVGRQVNDDWMIVRKHGVLPNTN